MTKSHFLSQKGLEERPHCKAFKQTLSFPLTEHALIFPGQEKTLSGSRDALTEQTLTYSFLIRSTDIDENQPVSKQHGIWSDP